MPSKLKNLFLFFLIFFSAEAFPSDGKIINPVTDVCWSCLFPLHIAGENTTPKHKDFIKYREKICNCPGGIVGVPFAFWEPSRMIEVTRTPYQLLPAKAGSLTVPLQRGLKA